MESVETIKRAGHANESWRIEKVVRLDNYKLRNADFRQTGAGRNFRLEEKEFEGKLEE